MAINPATLFEQLDALSRDTPRPPPPPPTIKRLNFSHEAIARWLLENPGGSLGDCAAEFGYTRGWLSIIIHSDAFKAKYHSLQAEADRLVIDDIPAKMRGTVSLALEGLADQVEKAVIDGSAGNRQFLLNASETLLQKLGYGANNGKVVINAPGAQTVNATVVEPHALERARQRLVEKRGENARVVDGEAERVDPAA